MSPQDLLEVVCTMKPVHGSLNPCPDKLHGIGNPLVYEPRGLSFLICERGRHTTSHKGTCMKDPAGPSPVATPAPLPSPLPSFQPSYPSPALSHLPPSSGTSLPLPGPPLCPLALPPFEQHPSTNALLHLVMGTHQKLHWEGVPTLLLVPPMTPTPTTGFQAPTLHPQLRFEQFSLDCPQILGLTWQLHSLSQRRQGRWISGHLPH